MLWLLLLFVLLDVINNATTTRKFIPFIVGSAFIVVIGIFLKILHWNGGNILLLLGHSALALTYLFQLFIRKNKALEEILKTVFIILLSIASLFKILHWEGADPLVLFAAIAFIIYFLTIGLKYIKSRKQNPS